MVLTDRVSIGPVKHGAPGSSAGSVTEFLSVGSWIRNVAMTHPSHSIISTNLSLCNLTHNSERHSEPSTPTQYGAVRTVRTQGLFSYREDYRTPAEPPSPRETTSEATWQLEPPSPRESAASSGESGRVSPSLRRDGSWFMQLLHTETKRMEGWCKEMESEAEENDLSEEILGKIRSAVGSAQLLMSQKFQQFYWLCQQNLDPSAMPRPTSQDLAGFWDLLQLSIDDVTMKFDQLQQIKNNNWRPVDSPEKKVRHPPGTVSPWPRQPQDVTACILYPNPAESINKSDGCSIYSHL
uniref:Discs, large (Drosophila) homolog-associated protein 2a n=1 Tax=Mastacembelus armatus TaxID=205130 RepID=A0A7N8X0F0_9TELE